MNILIRILIAAFFIFSVTRAAFGSLDKVNQPELARQKIYDFLETNPFHINAKKELVRLTLILQGPVPALGIVIQE